MVEAKKFFSEVSRREPRVSEIRDVVLPNAEGRARMRTMIRLSLPKTRAARRQRFTTRSPMLGRSDNVPLDGNAGAYAAASHVVHSDDQGPIVPGRPTAMDSAVDVA